MSVQELIAADVATTKVTNPYWAVVTTDFETVANTPDTAIFNFYTSLYEAVDSATDRIASLCYKSVSVYHVRTGQLACTFDVVLGAYYDD